MNGNNADSFFKYGALSNCNPLRQSSSAFETSTGFNWSSNRGSSDTFMPDRPPKDDSLSSHTRPSSNQRGRDESLNSSTEFLGPRSVYSRETVSSLDSTSGSLMQLFSNPHKIEMLDKMLQDPSIRSKFGLSTGPTALHELSKTSKPNAVNKRGFETVSETSSDFNIGLKKFIENGCRSQSYPNSYPSQACLPAAPLLENPQGFHNDDIKKPEASFLTSPKESKFESLQDWLGPTNKITGSLESQHRGANSDWYGSESRYNAVNAHSRSHSSEAAENFKQPSVGIESETSIPASEFIGSSTSSSSSRFESCESWTQNRNQSVEPSRFLTHRSLNSGNDSFRMNENRLSAKPRMESFMDQPNEARASTEHIASKPSENSEQWGSTEMRTTWQDHSDRISSIRSQFAPGVTEIFSSKLPFEGYAKTSEAGFQQNIGTNFSSREATNFSQPMEEDWRTWGSGSNSNSFACDACNRTFWNKDDFEKHKKQDHSPCPYPGCSFTAHEEAVEQHFANTHARGIHLKLDTPEDIKKWREDRKRKFPTRQNIELKEQERLAKESRGEVLQTKTFQNCRSKAPNGQGSNSAHGENKQTNSSNNNARSGFGSRPPKLTTRQKYLARFMRPEDAPRKPKMIEIKKEETSDDDDSGPEEAPISKTDPIQIAVGSQNNTSAVNSGSQNDENGSTSNGLPSDNRVMERRFESSPSEDFRARKTARCRKATLLEMLLAPEIRQERNVLLQCMFFIEQNSFFS